MRTTRQFISKRAMISLAGGLACQGLYKLYLYAYDREQFEDSNALVSLAMVLMAAGALYAILSVVAGLRNKP